MLTNKEIALIREELSTAKNPLFLYDSDADGLASFLLLYRIHREGKGIRVSTTSKIDASFLRKVEEINPDKIFVLDIPLMEQDFADKAKRPIFWIDHHPPQDIKNVHYFNPRTRDQDAYVTTTRMAYQVAQNENDLWIAAAGCLGDWHMPDFIDEFIAKYPNFLPERCDLAAALYQHPVGKLVKLFFFTQKGPSSEVKKSISILSKIRSPQEIFSQETVAGKFLSVRFGKINAKYEEVLGQARKKITKSKIVLFRYTSTQWSFTTNIANELAALNPQKVIIIAREKSGEMKASLRAQFRIIDALERAMVGIEGSGGGHPNACGAVIKIEDWGRFIQRFKEELKNEPAD